MARSLEKFTHQSRGYILRLRYIDADRVLGDLFEPYDRHGNGGSIFSANWSCSRAYFDANYA